MLGCTPVSGNQLFGLPLLKVAKMGISSRRESLKSTGHIIFYSKGNVYSHATLQAEHIQIKSWKPKNIQVFFFPTFYRSHLSQYYKYIHSVRHINYYTLNKNDYCKMLLTLTSIICPQHVQPVLICCSLNSISNICNPQV